MAVKWAVANGNWTAGATWNDGVVPTTDDDVYLNGHIINGGTGTGIKRLSANFITNGANADYGIVAGGHITIVLNNTTFDCDLVQKGNETLIVCRFGNQNNFFNIEGGVSNEDGYVITYDGSMGLVITINGSVNIGGMYSIFASNSNLNLAYSLNLNCPQYHSPNNIAIISHSNTAFTASSITLVGGVFENFNKGTGAVTTLTANVSEIIITSNLAVTTANITGKLTCRNNAILAATTLNIFGQIEYKSTNNTTGVRITTLNVLNPDTFTWHDVTEPRVNAFIILTNAEMNNRQQYPAEDKVKEGTEYVWGEKVGTYQQPPESVVLKGFVYDNGEKVGSLENQNVVGCVTKEDVREGVALIGMGEVGTLVVPSVDDVREGVIFDNGSVGTLIVEGGGERLRIADFGYYTRSTSITYIVDLTESDKPAFADCEEIVLRSLFPTLDLDNIPDKFFDDLFVQFLRYRLLVEYYRGTSINSKFTPSEPTAEIVNYANTKCEYWLNTANLFLQLWGEKYPNSVKKDRILL